MPMVHMAMELLQFFIKILSAPFETKLSDLLQDLPDAQIIVNILNVNKKEMNMTLGELFKQQMNMPNSFLQQQFNFISRVRVLYEEIRQNNATILQLMIKEERDNYFADLALSYILEMAMLYDTMDLQAEQDRLAKIQKMIENYLNQLQNLHNVHKELHAIGQQLAAISNRIQEIDRELDQHAEKNFAITIDKYKRNQENLINDLSTQLQQIDSQINVQNIKLAKAQDELSILKETNAPQSLINEKTIEVENLKSVVSKLQDIRQDQGNLLNKAKEDSQAATKLYEAGLSSWGTSHDSKISKLTDIQKVLHNKNKDTVSLTENIKEKAADIQKSYPGLIDKELNDIVEQAKVIHENTTANKDKFKTENKEFRKDITHLEEEKGALKVKEAKLQKEKETYEAKFDVLDKHLKSIHPDDKAVLKKAGIPVDTMQLGDFKNLVESRVIQAAMPTNQKSEKPWPPSSFSQTDLKLQQLMQKRSQNAKDKIDSPKLDVKNEPPEPPTNGFRR